MTFRPSPWVTLLVFGAIAIQLRLAWWQYDRYTQQRGKLDAITERMRRAPTDTLDDARAWQKVTLSGTFEPDPTFVSGRFEFGGPGLDVISVLALDDGQRILVNRGFLPLDRVAEVGTLAPPGPATVEGLLLPADDTMLPGGCSAGARRGALPATDTLPARFAGPDWPAIREHVGPPIADLLLVVGPELSSSRAKPREPLPATGYIARPKQIDHFGYAGQWTLIACVFFGGWLISGFRRGRALG